MKNVLSVIFAFAALLLVSSSVRAEEWSYTGYYPYVYAPSSDTWYYFPDSPPLVWDYSADDWVANPFGDRAFHLDAIFSQGPLHLFLRLPGVEDNIEVSFNYSGIEGGYFTDGVTHAIDVAYDVNSKEGTCLLYGNWVEDNGDWGSFGVQLHFDTAMTGRYTLIGSIGLESARIATFTGDFVLELPTVVMSSER